MYPFSLFFLTNGVTSGDRRVKMAIKFDKPYMGITELSDVTGLPKNYLKRIAGAQGAPTIKTPGGGKYFFKTDEFEKWVEEMNKRDSEYREKNRRRR
jgi:hypothetical protein